MSKGIKIGIATFYPDEKKLVIGGTTIEVEETPLEKIYLEPFSGSKEPEAWVVFTKHRVCVKIERKFFCGERRGFLDDVF